MPWHLKIDSPGRMSSREDAHGLTLARTWFCSAFGARLRCIGTVTMFIRAFIIAGTSIASFSSPVPDSASRPPAAATTADAQPIDAGELTLAQAEEVIAAATMQAKAGAGTGAIAVVDSGGHLVALHRLDGTFPAASHVAEGKARTAAEFRKPTRAFEEAINKGRIAMAAMRDWTPLQGGVPITVGGRVVGAIGVSGAASAQQDDEIATAGAAALSNTAAAK